MTTAVATRAPKLIEKFAERYSVDGNKLMDTLKATAFRQRGDVVVSNEQMMALLVVADQYGLNPFTKEIFAFNDKGAVVPVVSVDGWLRIINEHPQFDGMEFQYSKELVTPARGKECHAWIECVVFRKDRTRPTVIREYLDEAYQAPRGEKSFDGPWQSHTKRMLRHKALIQAGRVAFGFAGIHDEDEARQITERDMGPVEFAAVPQPGSLSEAKPASEIVEPRAKKDQAKTQERRAEQPQRAEREPGEDDEDIEAKPVSESVLRVLKVKLENAALGEADLRKQFGHGFEGVTTANYPLIVAWTEDPMPAASE